jgi:Uri superfamily endonuclease
MSDESICNETKYGLRGVYTLIIRLARPCKATIRKHVPVVVDRGLYLYTGSASGRGSASLEGRIRRHLRREKKEFWHVDRILACKSAHVVSVVYAVTTSKGECRVNAALLKHTNIRVPFKGLGSSDCRCESHFLEARGSFRSLRQKVRACYTTLGLRPRVLKTLRAGHSISITTS